MFFCPSAIRTDCVLVGLPALLRMTIMDSFLKHTVTASRCTKTELKTPKDPDCLFYYRKSMAGSSGRTADLLEDLENNVTKPDVFAKSTSLSVSSLRHGS